MPDGAPKMVARGRKNDGDIELAGAIVALQARSVLKVNPWRIYMGWVLTIIVGGILGWLASKVMKTDAQQGILLNIVVGIVGAALAGFLLSPLLGIPTINAANFSIGGLLISFVGALILLAIVNFLRRGRVR